ncbi:hypothetical protein [Aurantimonas coralicida]|uniref:hypothetical protein n=1 Tax=Aurantimonas coralicida TaxID=182270 RepID=UPI001D18D5FF|nr:hypothetical protein [Aurantimonas coralicida]MCC4298419.1 hypothetical protein [Aurantimonas coralicida]
MMNFVHGMERAMFAGLVGAANATGGTRTHVVRVSHAGTINKLIATLRSEHTRANRLAHENAALRRQLDEARQAMSIMTARLARR